MPKRIISLVLILVIFMGTNTSFAQDFLEISAPSAILMEMQTGKVLYEKNAHEILPPASVTKVMTMLLIMEAIDEKTLNYNDTAPVDTWFTVKFDVSFWKNMRYNGASYTNISLIAPTGSIGLDNVTYTRYGAL